MLVKLKDLLTIKNGMDYKHLSAGNIPVIGTGGIMLYVNKALYNSEAILLPRKGSLNNVMYINRPFWTVDTMFYAIPNKEKINAKYLYYYLSLIDFTRYDVGSTIPSMTSSLYYSLSIDIPPLNFQNRIAAILSAIDAQIERNNTMVKRLQVLAQAIYTRWFLQFEFPNEEGKPYNSSGGKVIYNDELKREIPNGWETKQLKECCEIVLGGTPKTEESEYWNGNINWLNSGEIANFPIISSELKITTLGMNESATTFMKKGTTVVSITGNLRSSILAIDSCANQSVVGILENSKYRTSYIFPFIKDMISTFTKISTGNCQQHINKGTIQDAVILVPGENILRKYYKKVENIYEFICKNALENQKLISLRDYLLPLLINGQLQ